MAYQTSNFQGPVEQLLASDYSVTTTGSTIAAATVYTVPTGFKGSLTAVKARLRAGATAHAEVFTVTILKASDSTSQQAAVTLAMNNAGAFNSSALGYDTTYNVILGTSTAGTVTPIVSLSGGDQIQIAVTTGGTTGTQYHFDFVGYLIP